jgi:putative oxidoreductase
MIDLFNSALDIARDGVAAGTTAGSAVVQLSMGAFFACSGWNKLTNKARHAAIVDTFKRDHVPAVAFNQWWVPGWELVGGAMLAAGVLPAFAAGVLFIICAVATLCEGAKRVAEYQPINEADRVADWLYLPEVIYCIALASLVVHSGYALV